MKNLFQGFGAVLYKEFIVMFRDGTTLFFMFFPPLIQIIAFGFALDMNVRDVAMAVYNEDRSRESRALIEQFVNTQTFLQVAEVHSVDELNALIRKGEAKVGLQIPPDYARNLRAGRAAQVQVLIDGSNSTVAQQALNTALGLGFRNSSATLLQASNRKELVLDVRPQVLYNPDMKSPNFYVPGVIGLALQIATVFATAMSIVRERERGTIEQLLVSPVSRWGLMLGKIVPYWCVGVTMTLSLFVVMRWVFNIHIAGNLFFLVISALLYIFALLSLGLLISTRARNQMQALQMSIALVLPTVFFSGFIFPRETMPWIFYAIGNLLPATFFIELMRAIVLRGALFADFWPDLLILFAMCLALFALCTLRFKRSLV